MAVATKNRHCDIGCFNLLASVIFRRMFYEQTKMNPLDTGEVIPGHICGEEQLCKHVCY
jgi:hypothetical protein